MNTWYQAINIFFFGFHIGLIFFNLFGWLFKRLRKWNLLTLGLTAFSWLVLGIFYGFGYCFLTDWHWQIREKLNYPTNSDSYIHFLFTRIFPVSISENTVDLLTAILFFLALIMSISMNAVDFHQKKKSRL
jgi:hypothetical protein